MIQWQLDRCFQHLPTLNTVSSACKRAVVGHDDFAKGRISSEMDIPLYGDSESEAMCEVANSILTLPEQHKHSSLSYQ